MGPGGWGKDKSRDRDSCSWGLGKAERGRARDSCSFGGLRKDKNRGRGSWVVIRVRGSWEKPWTGLAIAGGLLNLPGGEYHKTTDSRWPINLKITAVEGKDSAQPFALGDAHQSGVSQIHRQIAILAHQLFHARNVIDA